MFVMGIAERKNRQKQALRERILDAARRIVMREGFAALSMRKIADAIEYSPATLYLHFASRDEIAQALCAEGYAQLLETFVPLADIADPAERLKALGRAYVAFGVAHPQTYRLIFMEDPSYTGAALGGAAKNQAADEGADITASEATSGDAAEPEDDPGAAALHIMISALEELKAAGHLSASTDVAVWAEAFWATLHGIVALNLTCPVFPSAPLDTVVGLALDAWLGASHSTQSQSSATAGGTRKKKSSGAGAASPAESGHEPAAQPSSKKSAKAASHIIGPAPRRKAASA
jgi:AcrR family transcriptional regulator